MKYPIGALFAVGVLNALSTNIPGLQIRCSCYSPTTDIEDADYRVSGTCVEQFNEFKSTEIGLVTILMHSVSDIKAIMIDVNGRLMVRTTSNLYWADAVHFKPRGYNIFLSKEWYDEWEAVNPTTCANDQHTDPDEIRPSRRHDDPKLGEPVKILGTTAPKTSDNLLTEFMCGLTDEQARLLADLALNDDLLRLTISGDGLVARYGKTDSPGLVVTDAFHGINNMEHIWLTREYINEWFGNNPLPAAKGEINTMLTLDQYDLNNTFTARQLTYLRELVNAPNTQLTDWTGVAISPKGNAVFTRPHDDPYEILPIQLVHNKLKHETTYDRVILAYSLNAIAGPADQLIPIEQFSPELRADAHFKLMDRSDRAISAMQHLGDVGPAMPLNEITIDVNAEDAKKFKRSPLLNKPIVGDETDKFEVDGEVSLEDALRPIRDLDAQVYAAIKKAKTGSELTGESEDDSGIDIEPGAELKPIQDLDEEVRRLRCTLAKSKFELELARNDAKLKPPAEPTQGVMGTYIKLLIEQAASAGLTLSDKYLEHLRSGRGLSKEFRDIVENIGGPEWDYIVAADAKNREHANKLRETDEVSLAAKVVGAIDELRAYQDAAPKGQRFAIPVDLGDEDLPDDIFDDEREYDFGEVHTTATSDAVYSMSTPGYEELADVLYDAYIQASAGKGLERHANDLPFHKQRMQGISDLLDSPDGLTFQAIKKVTEGMGMSNPDATIHELLGAIVYISGAIIWLRRQDGHID